MLEPTPLYGGNADFLDALYEQYLRDPASVEERWRSYFTQLEPPGGEQPHGPIRDAIVARAAMPRAAAGMPAAAPSPDARQAAVSRLIQVWINRGHLVATIDPLALTARPRPRALELEH
ncbi:MAG TPA: 2-oxoglutarate dehydrogenase E1 component, partial [Steroidobacteraceae bacterium]|nr:2-oxoglutarate dehydrogenase E1 component [Steroidobacteraceae bacterium]